MNENMDKELGTVAQGLFDGGQMDAAVLLTEAMDVRFVWKR